MLRALRITLGTFLAIFIGVFGVGLFLLLSPWTWVIGLLIFLVVRLT